MEEKNQNSWHLACIQTASLGLPGIILSPQLANTYGAGTSTVSTLISGLVLWIIGFAIVSMAIEQRRNAIENAEAYIGRPGAKLAALISIIGFPIWYVYQIHETTGSISSVLLDVDGFGIVKNLFGPIIGICIAILALGNVIRIIKNLTVIFLPILLCYYIYLVISSGRIPDFKGFTISASCTVAYISFLFAGMVNLPTFFRHARSRYDAYLSLTWITLIVVFFQISGIWISEALVSPYIPFKIPVNASFFGSLSLRITNVLFLLVLLVCSNLVNLYFSYPSWEAIFPKIKKYKKLFLLGVFNTFLYVFTLLYPKFYEFLVNANSSADDFIANLGTALILIFLVREIVRHRPTALEKMISTTSWIIGCFVTIYTDINGFNVPLLWGIGATMLSFIIAFFIEEPFWSTKKLKDFLTVDKKGNEPPD